MNNECHVFIKILQMKNISPGYSFDESSPNILEPQHEKFRMLVFQSLSATL